MSVILSLIKLGCYLTEYRCNDYIECLNWNLYWFVLAEKTQATTKSKSTTPDLTTSTTTATENSTPTWINDIFQVLFWSQMSIWSFYLFPLFFSSLMTMALKIKPHQMKWKLVTIWVKDSGHSNSSMGEIEILAFAIPFAYRSVLSYKPKIFLIPWNIV